MYSLKGTIGNLFMRCCAVLPLKKKAVFVSYSGSSCSDNPKAIYEAMKELAPDYEYIWLMEDPNAEIPGAKAARFGSFRGLYHMATARLWVDNARKREWTVKRKGQYYVQTWHGGFALKKVEADAQDKLPAQYIRNAKRDSEMADLFISGCTWCTKNYRDAFWYDGPILEYGQPRSDIFYRDPGEICRRVREHYGLDGETRLALYAPTFRVEHRMDCYDMDYTALLSALEEHWGGKWKILVRLHPNVADQQGMISYSDSVLNGSAYQDINELIVSSDLLISDYSSCMFDAMEAGKRVILYASDLERYNADRGTYLALDELPFPLAQSNGELSAAVRDFDQRDFQSKVKCFMEKVGFFNSANAAERTAHYILERLEEL